MNHETAVSTALSGKNGARRRVGRNTWIELRGDDVAIKLHPTDIITFRKDGSVVLNSGGYQTNTTKARMNEFLDGWGIYQESRVWYLRKGGERHVFSDGIVINSDGSVSGGADANDKLALAKMVLEYSSNYIDALFLGDVPAPSQGDCWDCAMTVQGSGESMGDFSGSGHLISHMDESYFVPSLMLRAIDENPVSQWAKALLGGIWGYCDDIRYHPASLGSAKRQLRDSLRKYMRTRLGLAK